MVAKPWQLQFVGGLAKAFSLMLCSAESSSMWLFFTEKPPSQSLGLYTFREIALSCFPLCRCKQMLPEAPGTPASTSRMNATSSKGMACDGDNGSAFKPK